MMAAVVAVVSGAGAAGMLGLWSSAQAAAPATRVTMTDADPNAQAWRFEPADLTVKAGAAVTWHNGGGQVHSVSADDKSFESGGRAPGSDWQFTFKTPGQYAYHCTPHPWMKAMIRVVR
jgi:plastocyanin